MKPEAAVANPTTIAWAAGAGVPHSAVAAAKALSVVVKRIYPFLRFVRRTSVQFLQGRLHRSRQPPLERPSSPGEFPVAGEAGCQIHQDDAGGDPDRDLLNPVRDPAAAPPTPLPPSPPANPPHHPRHPPTPPPPA